MAGEFPPNNDGHEFNSPLSEDELRILDSLEASFAPVDCHPSLKDFQADVREGYGTPPLIDEKGDVIMPSLPMRQDELDKLKRLFEDGEL